MPELTSLPTKPRRHIFLSIVGFTILAWIIVFAGYTGYFLWQLKYGSAEDIAKTHFSFKNAKFTSASSAGVGPRAPENGQWAPFIHPYNPTLGTGANLVTVTAFIDFECPYSQDNYQVFKEVMDTYGGAIKVVFKFLPLTSIHPNALAASEAAACANDQGKFWPYYHHLFETKKFTASDLQAAAVAAGLDSDLFTACVKSLKHRPNIEQDVNEAVSLGVRGTPTYFINTDVIEGSADRAVWDNTILKNITK